MGLRTWAWPSFTGLHMGTKTSAGPSVARLGLNNSLLITGRPSPEPQPEEKKDTGSSCQPGLCWSIPSVSTQESQGMQTVVRIH